MHLECECRDAHRWGEHGRLAHGDVVGTRPAPGAVHTADSAGFAMVAAGENHTLALSDAGDLFAAGHGLDGAAAGAQQGIVRCLLGDAAAAASCVGVAAAAACCCCCCCWCAEFLLLSLSLSSRNTDLRAGHACRRARVRCATAGDDAAPRRAPHQRGRISHRSGVHDVLRCDGCAHVLLLLLCSVQCCAVL